MVKNISDTLVVWHTHVGGMTYTRGDRQRTQPGNIGWQSITCDIEGHGQPPEMAEAIRWSKLLPQFSICSLQVQCPSCQLEVHRGKLSAPKTRCGLHIMRTNISQAMRGLISETTFQIQIFTQIGQTQNTRASIAPRAVSGWTERRFNSYSHWQPHWIR